MEVAETLSSLNPNPNLKQPSICEECKKKPSKYTCPGCSIRSCSLPCVKSHKQRTSCTGKRHRTQFVPLSQFDDNLIISDYNFLEEAKRVAESAKRLRFQLSENPHYKTFKLRGAARRRKTNLFFLPVGMSRREKNQTCYVHSKRLILWTIEWRFDSTDIVLVDNGVDENYSLYSVIEKHLKPGPWSNQLRPFCEGQIDSLKFFIRKNAKDKKSPFRELDVKAPIRHQLGYTTIVENPIIHVFLSSTSLDFEIVKDRHPYHHKSETKEPLKHNSPSPKGVLFKEEEIPDDVSEEPNILDLMDPEVEEEPRYRNAIKTFSKELETENANVPGDSSKEFFDADYFGLDLDQDMKDVFSGFIEQENLDDFLNLDEFLEVEELEEGEIPGGK